VLIGEVIPDHATALIVDAFLDAVATLNR